VASRIPSPCRFDGGLLRGVAQQYAPVDAFVFPDEAGSTCRRGGGDECVDTVYW
jgi:hypothetical protein